MVVNQLISRLVNPMFDYEKYTPKIRIDDSLLNIFKSYSKFILAGNLDINISIDSKV